MINSKIYKRAGLFGRRNRKMFVPVIICMLFISCQRRENVEVSGSALSVVGGQDLLDMTEILVLPDGGFAVGATTVVNNDADYRLFRFGSDGTLIWDRTFSVVGLEKLQTIMLNREGQILMAGFTYGYEADSIPLTESRVSTVLLMLVSMDGELIWKRSVLIDTYSVPNPFITDLIQDSDGNYVMSAHIGWSEVVGGNTLYFGENGMVVKFTSKGVLRNYAVSTADPGIPCIAEAGDAYQVIQFRQLTNNADFTELQKNFTQRVNAYTSFKPAFVPSEINEKGLAEDGICDLKRVSGTGVISYTSFGREKSFELRYDPAQGKPETRNIRGLPEIVVAIEMTNGDLLLKTKGGNLLITDSDYTIKKTIPSELPAHSIAELSDGKIVQGYLNQQSINLFFLTKDGELQ